MFLQFGCLLLTRLLQLSDLLRFLLAVFSLSGQLLLQLGTLLLTRLLQLGNLLCFLLTIFGLSG
ncbi:hypothetical protein D3C73_272770 [compost metagenome]